MYVYIYNINLFNTHRAQKSSNSTWSRTNRNSLPSKELMNSRKLALCTPKAARLRLCNSGIFWPCTSCIYCRALTADVCK